MSDIQGAGIDAMDDKAFHPPKRSPLCLYPEANPNPDPAAASRQTRQEILEMAAAVEKEEADNTGKDESAEAAGDFLTFGSIIVLQHLASGKFIAGSSITPASAKVSGKAKATAMFLVSPSEESDECHLRVGTGYRAQVDRDRVRYPSIYLHLPPFTSIYLHLPPFTSIYLNIRYRDDLCLYCVRQGDKRVIGIDTDVPLDSKRYAHDEVSSWDTVAL